MPMQNVLLFPDGTRKRLKFRSHVNNSDYANFVLYFGKGKEITFEEMLAHCQSGAVLQTSNLTWISNNVYPGQDMSQLTISELTQER